ncbi:unnamed protein product [Ectocarpus sp. 6 AP-2014]
MQALHRLLRVSGRVAVSQRHVLGAVGGAGLCVSTVAIHRQMAAGAIPSCSAMTASTAAATAGADGNIRHLEGEDITVYQYKICPFCNKLKVVMDFLGIPYSVTEVNPLTKKEIKFSEDYRKVPIVRMGGELFKDSPVIIDELIARLRETKVMSDEEHAVFCSSDAKKWAEWADKQLAVLLFPNLTRNFSESYQAFSYVNDVDTFSMMDKVSNQVIGSAAMWAAQGKIKKKYNIDDEREALFSAIKDWTDALGEVDGPFFGGDRPNLGDLCVFGCIRAIEGLDTHKDVLARQGVRAWYQSMVSTLDYAPST